MSKARPCLCQKLGRNRCPHHSHVKEIEMNVILKKHVGRKDGVLSSEAGDDEPRKPEPESKPEESKPEPVADESEDEDSSEESSEEEESGPSDALSDEVKAGLEAAAKGSGRDLLSFMKENGLYKGTSVKQAKKLAKSLLK